MVAERVLFLNLDALSMMMMLGRGMIASRSILILHPGACSSPMQAVMNPIRISNGIPEGQRAVGLNSDGVPPCREHMAGDRQSRKCGSLGHVKVSAFIWQM